MPSTNLTNNSSVKFNWGIIGHRSIVNFLQGNVLRHKYSQAYLFIGPAQVGKSAVATKFINSLYCLAANPTTKNLPCGHCTHCQELNKNLHPDVYWIKRELNDKTGKLKQDTSVEQIRLLQDKLNLHPFLNSFKFAIIEEAETLNEESYNSLLKTLEEPFAKTIIILLAKNVNRLPATIVSRCQVFRFNPVGQKEINAALVERGVKKDLAKNLAALSRGYPGLAINYLAADYLKDYLADIEQFLSWQSKNLSQRFTQIKSIVRAAKNQNRANQELTVLLQSWQAIIRDLIIHKTGASGLIFHQELLTQIERTTKPLTLASLVSLAKQLSLAQGYLARNLNPQLVLENLILHY